MTALYLFDHAQRSISDATVSIDGQHVPYDEVYDQYRLDGIAATPSRIEIEHPRFEPLVYEAFPWLTNRLYLLAPGDLFYLTSGVKVACLPLPELILIVLSASAAPAALDELCQEQGLVVKHHGHVNGKDPLADFGCQPNVVARRDGHPPRPRDPLWAALRAAPGVTAVGPLLTHDESLNEVMGLDRFLTLLFRSEVDEERARQVLKEHGYIAEPSLAFGDTRLLHVPLAPQVGHEAAVIADRLDALPEVVLASNDLILRVSS